jgi:uncharacterized membrane protein YeaQ/YmgE (transglycosylase-associated protein family)
LIIPIILFVVFIALVLGIWITFSLLGLIVTLLVAALIGWLAVTIVPGRIHYGWLGSIVAGVLGSWLGSILLGHFGPSIGGIALIPALIGAVILVFIVDLVVGSRRGRNFGW